MSLGICLSHSVCVCVRLISLDGEGNALYPVLSSSSSSCCCCCCCCTMYTCAVAQCGLVVTSFVTSTKLLYMQQG